MLKMNEDGKWELDGREMSCGSAIEVLGVFGKWELGCVEHSPEWGYFVELPRGKHCMTDTLDVFRLPARSNP